MSNQFGDGQGGSTKSSRKLRRALAVLVVASVWAAWFGVGPTASRAAATSYFGGSQQQTWWFWTSNVPFSYTVYSGGKGQYTPYCYNAQYGWYDYFTYDSDNVSIHDGNAWWLPPDPIYVVTWLAYYQRGYNFVNDWGGQFYVNCLKSPNDSTLCVGDHPNESYWEATHVGHDYEGWPDSGCCTDTGWQWVK